VGSGIFKSAHPERTAAAIVEAVAHYEDASLIARVSEGLGPAMPGIEIASIPASQTLAARGW